MDGGAEVAQEKTEEGNEEAKEGGETVAGAAEGGKTPGSPASVGAGEDGPPSKRAKVISGLVVMMNIFAVEKVCQRNEGMNWRRCIL